MPDPALLCGLDDSALVEVAIAGRMHRLHPRAADAVDALAAAAAAAGFELAVASSWRSFDRQLAIFNDKLAGRRPVLDDAGATVALGALEPIERIWAVMRFSALPGGSRHHWGTDIDVYDRAGLPPGYEVQLTPSECGPGGVFETFHRWLDDYLAGEQPFFRPYVRDRGGVAPEPWHLSYAPLAQEYAGALTPTILRSVLVDKPLLQADTVLAHLDELFERFIAVWPGSIL